MSTLASRLDTCAQEQVQHVGHIQRRGLLFALTEPDLIVRHVSSNVDSVLGTPAASLLGKSIESVLSPEEFELLRGRLCFDQQLAVWAAKLKTNRAALCLECVAHRHNGLVILEFELPLAKCVYEAVDVGTDLAMQLVNLEGAKDIAQLTQLATKEIRRMTGFDRVMVYEFDEAWNGEVIAEAAGASDVAYLGLHFPASDIPPQVRALFLLNRVRAIADVNEIPVPLIAEADSAGPLDLTRSLLRSASPIHLEYLRNMGVRATLVIAIVLKGRLWGVFACHHSMPYWVDCASRSAADLMVQIYASQLTLRMDNAELERSNVRRDLLEHYMADLALSVVGTDPKQGYELLHLLRADGLLISIGDVISRIGVTVAQDAMRDIAARLKATAAHGVASSHCLIEIDSDAASYAPDVSGALYIQLSDTNDYLLFVRRELVETVLWAGNPNKAVQADKENRLFPRRSFEAWREALRGYSRRWTSNDLQMAVLLRDRLEQRDRARTLHVLSERFDLATHQAHVGVWERWDASGKVWWNEVMYQIFGQDPASFRPDVDKWLGAIRPDDMKRIRHGMAPAVGVPGASTLKYRITRPDGTVRHVESTGATDWVGNSISGILIDVTAQVEAEQREEALQRQLRQSSHKAGMAEIATGVLHNFGNVLNSLGIANTALRRSLKGLRLDRLEQASSLIQDHRAGLGVFLTEDERGRHLPEYLQALSAQLLAEGGTAMAEAETMEKLLQLLRDIVSAHQAYATAHRLFETISLAEVVDAALLALAPKTGSIDIDKRYEELPPITTDRHKLQQILMNLLSNGLDAVHASPAGSQRIVLRIARDAEHALVSVEDTGVGMSEEVLARLWQFGFSAKPGGYGFGLHNSANAAREIGSTITAQSEGPGKGSRFSIRLPLDRPAG